MYGRFFAPETCQKLQGPDPSLKSPRRARMTARANAKVIAPKRAFPVMTSQATLPASAGVMIQRLWLGHLPPLRHAGTDLMTLPASYFAMLAMTEADPKRPGELRCPGITAELMAGTA